MKRSVPQPLRRRGHTPEGGQQRWCGTPGSRTSTRPPYRYLTRLGGPQPILGPFSLAVTPTWMTHMECALTYLRPGCSVFNGPARPILHRKSARETNSKTSSWQTKFSKNLQNRCSKPSPGSVILGLSAARWPFCTENRPEKPILRPVRGKLNFPKICRTDVSSQAPGVSYSDSARRAGHSAPKISPRYHF